MKSKVKGKIAVIDMKSNMESVNIQVTTSEEKDKVSKRERDFKREIVQKLSDLNVKCLFYSDTNPEFESYLTEMGISGIVTYARENLDQVCKATGATAPTQP